MLRAIKYSGVVPVMTHKGQPFWKYEGLGNDFIILEAEREIADPAPHAVKWCDRHFGIGADGVLWVLPGQTPQARATMAVVNADGSRPEMCGNGLRCVALHLALRDESAGASYMIDTGSGARCCEVERSGSEASVRLEMGHARVLGPHRVTLGGRDHEFLRVSTGNPHAVLFDADFDLPRIDREAPRVSAGIEGGANVGFARMRQERRLQLIVWERGVGRTLACGTGAVAAAAAACHLGRAPTGEPIAVELPGGGLEVTIQSDTAASLRGPARLVFTGEFPGG